MLKIGITPSEIDAIMLLGGLKADFLCFCAAKTSEEKWVRRFLPAKMIVSYPLLKNIGSLETADYDRIIANSGFSRAVKKSKVKLFWLIVNPDNLDFLEQWSKRLGVDVITTDFKLHKQLENKIWFDRFLQKNNLPKPASQILKSAGDKIKLKGKLVVQEVFSSGSEGTFIVPDGRYLKNLFKREKISAGHNCLLRSFIKGIPLGISVIIADKKIVLSAVRVQCYSRPGKKQPEFLGIQWLGAQALSQDAKTKINHIFEKLGLALYSINFRGLANIDFMLTPDNQVFILECNPRFSAATGQLVKFIKLKSPVNYLDLFIKRHEVKHRDGEKIKPKFYGLPDQNFQGSSLEINWAPTNNIKELEIKKLYSNGLYAFGSEIEFLSPDARKIRNSGRQFVYLSFLGQGEKFKSETSLGRVLTNFAVFGNNGHINKNGIKILKKFKY